MSTPNQDPKTVVKYSERLWSDEVALANADEEPQPVHDTVYKFSNGRAFVEKNRYEDSQ